MADTRQAVITPCFMMIVSMWYTRSEAPVRAGSFYCFNGFGSMLGGILFYGVGQADGWDVWRIIFVMCGGMTVVWGIVLFFYLPNNILTAKRYSVEQKALLIARSQSNKTGVFSRKIKPAQIKEAFKDLQVWLLFFYTLLNEVVNGGIANFGKLIVKGFTKDALLTTAYGIPYGAWLVFFIFTGPFCASRFKNFRTIVMMTWVLPTLIAVILYLKLDRGNKNGLLMAYYIVSWPPSDDIFEFSLLTYLAEPVVCGRSCRRAPNARCERCRLHQACHCHGVRLPGILRGKHHRTPGVPRLRGTHLRHRMQGHHGMHRWPGCARYRDPHVADPAKQAARRRGRCQRQWRGRRGRRGSHGLDGL